MFCKKCGKELKLTGEFELCYNCQLAQRKPTKKELASTEKGLQVYELIQILKQLDEEKVIYLCGGTEWNFYEQFDSYSIDTENNKEYGKRF